MSPDLINGLFECAGGTAICFSIVKLYHDKAVAGVSWQHVIFFTAWGFWNLFYYPHLDQWFSFAGGAFLAAMQIVWLCQIIFYNWRNRYAHP